LALRQSPERAGFPVFPLTAELRTQLGLGSDVVRYATLESPFDPSEPDSLKVYLDEGLYSKVSAKPDSAGARALQRELWVAAMTTVVLEALNSAEIDHITVEDLDDSWLGRLLLWVGGPKVSDQGVWLDHLREQPAIFFSQIDVLAQHAVDWNDVV
jgi:hypothetical protein